MLTIEPWTVLVGGRIYTSGTYYSSRLRSFCHARETILIINAALSFFLHQARLNFVSHWRMSETILKKIFIDILKLHYISFTAWDKSNNVGHYLSIYFITSVTEVRCPVADHRLEVATPTPRPLSGRGYHALTWRSHGHSVAAYLWRRLCQTVLLPGKCTVWRALAG